MEQEVSKISAVLVKAHARLPHAEKLRSDIAGCLQAERAALTLANANIKHMREVADHVVLNEWVEVSSMVVVKAEAVFKKQMELAQVNAEIESINASIPDLELQKKVRQQRIGEYGQVHILKTR